MRVDQTTCDRCGADCTEKQGARIDHFRNGREYDLCKNCAWDLVAWIEAARPKA